MYNIKAFIYNLRSIKYYVCVCVCVWGMCVCVCARARSVMSNSATPWTIAHQVPLSKEFSMQEYWSRLPFPTSGDLLNPGIKPESRVSPVLAGGFFTCATWEAYKYYVVVAKSLQSCPTLCDPTDSSPPGSPIPGILQARTLEWVAMSFSNAWKWKVKGKSLSRVRLLATPWTAAYQAPPSMGFSRQEYWSGVPLPSLINTIEWFKNN